ncbi:Hypothetical predicted protein [Podarcis lilfordi]|uniref:Uncharacterized protein n=1 Tax=Podarcis lilfordi TaxID=74358 RepID=A0AA35P727_9SAUR|nr:Hypothetical predicted protein [Podarcis lilfordi]
MFTRIHTTGAVEYQTDTEFFCLGTPDANFNSKPATRAARKKHPTRVQPEHTEQKKLQTADKPSSPYNGQFSSIQKSCKNAKTTALILLCCCQNLYLPLIWFNKSWDVVKLCFSFVCFLMTVGR